jgi:hypothetical protein
VIMRRVRFVSSEMKRWIRAGMIQVEECKAYERVDRPITPFFAAVFRCQVGM